jgi:hypothetical protein
MVERMNSQNKTMSQANTIEAYRYMIHAQHYQKWTLSHWTGNIGRIYPFHKVHYDMEEKEFAGFITGDSVCVSIFN